MMSSLPESDISETQAPGDIPAAALPERTARFAETALPVALGVFIFTTPFAKVVASIVHSLCIILYLLRFRKKSNRRMVSAAKAYYLVVASYCGILILSLVYTPDLSNGIHEVWRQITRLSTALILIETVSTGKLARTYFLAFIAGTAVLAAIGLGEAFFLHASRPPTMWHPVHGANILLMGFVASLAAVRFRRFTTLFVVSAGLILGGIYVTGTRGVWIAVVILLVMLPFLAPALSLRRKLLILAGVLIVCTLTIQTSFFRERASAALNDIRIYQKKDMTADPTSVGDRFYMWKASILMVKKHPLLGTGTGGWRSALRDIIAAGNAPEALIEFGNPHNIFLDALSTRGPLGLAALCMLIGYPAYIAARHRRSLIKGPDALLMLSCTIAFTVAGLTDTLIIIRGVFASYLILTGLSLAMILRPDVSEQMTGSLHPSNT